MAEQGTVLGTAAQQLRPLENNNIGAIVQENIRFWEQRDGDIEAKRKAAEARQREFEIEQNAKKQKRLDDYFGNLPTEDSEGYLNFQVAKGLDIVQEKYLENALVIANGSFEEQAAARIRNSELENKLLAWSKVNNASQEAANRLKDQEYNPFVDFEFKGVMDRLKGGGYKLDENLNMVTSDMNNPTETITVNPDELLGTITSVNFSGLTNFDELGDAQADTIAQDVINGNVGVSALNRENALSKAKILLTDEKLAREITGRYNIGGVGEDPINFNDITPEQLERAAIQFSEEFIEPSFIKKRNDLDNALTIERLKGARRENEESEINLSVLTQEDGNTVRNTEFQGTDVELSENDFIISMSNSLNIPSTDPNNVNPVKGENIIIGDDGEVYVAGKQEKEVRDQVYDKQGNPVFETEAQFVKDADGTVIIDPSTGKERIKEVQVPVVTERKIQEDVLITDDRAVGNALLRLKDPKTGRKFETVDNARNYVKSLAQEKRAEIDSRKPSQPKTDAFGNIIE